MNRKLLIVIVTAAVIGSAANARADLLWMFDDGQGLSAEMEIKSLAPRQLQISVTNTSTALPASVAWDTSNQLLTSVSLDLGDDVNIIGGSAVLGIGAATINFDKVCQQLTAGADVSSEWGYHNDGEAVDLARNVISTLRNHATAFAHGNLDGPANLSGPQGGLVSDPMLMDLGGLGGIKGPIVFTIELDKDISITNLNPRYSSLEFGSDAAYVHGSTEVAPVPEPSTLAMLLVGGSALGYGAWRKKKLHRLAV